MLIKCPECGLQASDKALSCPHCGFPFQQNPIKPKIRKYNRRRRLPNGFGQITEIKGRSLRKPFRAMVTVGKDDNGRPICKPLKPQAYFATYNEAYDALVDFNKDPYNLDNEMTMQELFEKWMMYRESLDRAKGTLAYQKSVWNTHSTIKNMKLVEVRIPELRKCIYDIDTSLNNKLKLKQVLNMMYDYALQYQLVNRNYARDIFVPKELKAKVEKDTQPHRSFTEEELNILLSNEGKGLYYDMMIIDCYSGLRPTELLILKTANINLDENCMIGGIKTQAGIDRYVPIHPKIKHLIKKYYNEAIKYNSEYLFVNSKNIHEPIPYDTYWWNFSRKLKAINIDSTCTPHNCRKTFVTKAKKDRVDEYALKYIIGHVIKDLTERVYTDRDTDWLQEEMQKIR